MFMRPYGSIFVLMDSDWSLSVLIGTFLVLMDSNGYVWVLMRPYGSLKILMGPLWSWLNLIRLFASL